MTTEHIKAHTKPDQDFDHFADDWWSPDGRLSSLHKINPIRLEFFKEEAEAEGFDFDGSRILDLGCGGGVLSEALAGLGARVTGIDLSPTAIEAARRHARVTGGKCLDIEYRNVSADALVKENTKPFDAIFCSEVLEHVDDPAALVKEAALLLRKGGLFFFSTINKTIKARFLAVFMAEDILGLLPPGTHDSKRFIKPSELSGFLRESGVNVKEARGLSYDVLKRGFRISRDTSVNYMGYGVKI
jgi:2-polyprenyl-6-hydroxyphenyl methylase/3-demethylubiquinone-9 3-methyltransferase